MILCLLSVFVVSYCSGCTTVQVPNVPRTDGGDNRDPGKSAKKREIPTKLRGYLSESAIIDGWWRFGPLWRTQSHVQGAVPSCPSSSSSLHYAHHGRSCVPYANPLEFLPNFEPHRIRPTPHRRSQHPWYASPSLSHVYTTLISLIRPPCLHRAKRKCGVAFPRHPSLCRPEQRHPQHDRRGAPLDERKDGDFKGGGIQPHQTGHQERALALCPQLLPPPRLHLELRCFPPGLSTFCRYLA